MQDDVLRGGLGDQPGENPKIRVVGLVVRTGGAQSTHDHVQHHIQRLLAVSHVRIHHHLDHAVLGLINADEDVTLEALHIALQVEQLLLVDIAASIREPHLTDGQTHPLEADKRLLAEDFFVGFHM